MPRNLMYGSILNNSILTREVSFLLFLISKIHLDYVSNRMDIIAVIKRRKEILFIVSFIYNLIFSPTCLRFYLKKNANIKGAFLKNVKIKIVGEGRLYIGPKTIIKKSVIEVIGDNSVVKIEGGSTNIKNSFFTASKPFGIINIASGFTSEGCSIQAHEEKTISIGRDCMFSSGIILSTTDYHTIISLQTGLRVNNAKEIKLADHIWIGRNVTILKGSIIANDTIIGTGSIVNGNLSTSNAIYAGVPAKIIKHGVNWNRTLLRI